MADSVHHSGVVAGTTGGTFLTVLANISSGDIIHTSILAAVGAVVSFGISFLLRWLVRCIRKKVSV